MSTPIIITAIICVTVLIIAGIVQFVQYKLKNNDTLKDIKSELKYLNTQLDINNRWIEIYDKNFEVIGNKLNSIIRNKLNEIKNETNEL